MKISDLVALISLLISCFSLLISAFNAYWTLLRKPKYVSPSIRWIAFGLLPPDNTLVINFPITITNVGSQTGVIDSFYVELTNSVTLQAERFYASQEGKITPQQPIYIGWDRPIPVSLKAGESDVKNYIFYPDSLDFNHTKGPYMISLYAYLNGNKKPIWLFDQALDFKDVLRPRPDQNFMPCMYSFNLYPKKILVVSHYGTLPE